MRSNVRAFTPSAAPTGKPLFFITFAAKAEAGSLLYDP
jgi:hypothetical protein